MPSARLASLKVGALRPSAAKKTVLARSVDGIILAGYLMILQQIGICKELVSRRRVLETVLKYFIAGE
jgi:hypothetical protein